MGTPHFFGSATAENNGEIYRTIMTAHQHLFIADEPKELGGGETGATPGDYLCMALASCKAITVRMYVERKGWKVDHISVKVDFAKSDQMPSRMNTFLCELKVTGDLTPEQKKRILEIAKICPVDRLL